MKTLLAAMVLAAVSSTAMAQVVYEAPRYQYGRYGEVYYGGRNSAIASPNYVYLPPSLQSAYAARRTDGRAYNMPYMPYGPGGPFFSPYSPSISVSNPAVPPYVFTDFLPYEEAGQFGFTPDDARNEAYQNAPRLIVGWQSSVLAPPAPAQQPQQEQPAAQPTASAEPAPAPGNSKDKAIPLLNWAKNERERNPALYKALIDEARKYDADATQALERSTATER